MDPTAHPDESYLEEYKECSIPENCKLVLQGADLKIETKDAFRALKEQLGLDEKSQSQQKLPF